MHRANPRLSALILIVALLAALFSFLNWTVTSEVRDLVEDQRIEHSAPDYHSEWSSMGIRFEVNTYADRAPAGLDAWTWHEEKLAPAVLDFPPDEE